MRDNALGLVSHPRMRAVLIAAMMMGISAQAWSAVMSSPTGRIEGRAPTATGTLGILNPAGVALSTASVYRVNYLRKPSDFLPDLSGLTTSDVDGDDDGMGGPPTMSAQAFASQAWTWKRDSDGRVLTTAEQRLAFNQAAGNVNGTRYKVTATVPVTISTSSGAPSNQTYTIASPIYTVDIDIPPTPTIRVNGWTTTLSGGFPNTAFVGANFQFFMNGSNASSNAGYTYTSSQPGWLSVSPTGVVTVTRKPAVQERIAVITMTSTSDPSQTWAKTVAPSRWYETASSTDYGMQAASYCASRGGLTVPARSEITHVTNSLQRPDPLRAENGYLAAEWGDLRSLGTQFSQGGYWLKDLEQNWQWVYNASDGSYSTGRDPTINKFGIICTRSLLN